MYRKEGNFNGCRKKGNAETDDPGHLAFVLDLPAECYHRCRFEFEENQREGSCKNDDDDDKKKKTKDNNNNNNSNRRTQQRNTNAFFLVPSDVMSHADEEYIAQYLQRRRRKNARRWSKDERTRLQS